jgi:hypothetical protein
MQHVITINLNGNAYQLDEDACDALRAYLGRAEAELEANPDKAEIISDLEQAIAEKCRRFLGPHKTVIVLVEIEQVLKEMGPVEGERGAEGGNGPAHVKSEQGADAPKRLYRIRDGGQSSGSFLFLSQCSPRASGC